MKTSIICFGILSVILVIVSAIMHYWLNCATNIILSVSWYMQYRGWQNLQELREEIRQINREIFL